MSILLLAHGSGREGRVSSLLRRKGYAVEWCCPAAGDTLPAPEATAAAVVFGGPQSANDELDYVRREIDWIGEFAASGKPFLGICLGAQMLAKALGARVARHPEGLHEIGYYELRATPSGRDLFPASMQVYHWHREGFELPPGAELLATGDGFPHQAYRVGANAYGLQFHPEVTPAMLRRWLKAAHEDLANHGAQPAERHLAGCERFDAPLNEWTSGFLDRWLNR